MPVHLESRKQGFDMPQDDVFQKEIMGLLTCFLDGHQTVEISWHLHNGPLSASGTGCIFGKFHDDVQGLVEQQRKRVGWVQAQGGQDRVHLRFIITVDSFKLMLRQLLATQEMYALLLQRRDEGFIPALKLLLKHATGTTRHSLKGFLRGAPIRSEV